MRPRTGYEDAVAASETASDPLVAGLNDALWPNSSNPRLLGLGDVQHGRDVEREGGDAERSLPEPEQQLDELRDKWQSLWSGNVRPTQSDIIREAVIELHGKYFGEGGG